MHRQITVCDILLWQLLCETYSIDKPQLLWICNSLNIVHESVKSVHTTVSVYQKNVHTFQRPQNCYFHRQRVSQYGLLKELFFRMRIATSVSVLYPVSWK